MYLVSIQPTNPNSQYSPLVFATINRLLLGSLPFGTLVRHAPFVFAGVPIRACRPDHRRHPSNDSAGRSPLPVRSNSSHFSSVSNIYATSRGSPPPSRQRSISSRSSSSSLLRASARSARAFQLIRLVGFVMVRQAIHLQSAPPAASATDPRSPRTIPPTAQPQGVSAAARAMRAG